jgi:APA family basic amino acid/polyamine antiporter
MVGVKSNLTEPKAGLTTTDAVAIIVGIIIGSSIYKAPPDVFVSAGGDWQALLVWVLVGLLSLVGALCYAELATAYPTAGGDYTYISRSFGSGFGFFFAWAELAIIRTGGSIAIMAYVFAQYADTFLASAGLSLLSPGENNRPPTTTGIPLGVYAVLSILALTLVNALGIRPGKWTQNILTLVKVLGLGGVVVAGVVAYYTIAPQEVPAVEPAERLPFQTLALAMVFVFYAYGGWNEAAYVASEMRGNRRSIAWALILGTGLVTLIYVAVNLAYLMGLGYAAATRSEAIASDLLAVPLGTAGSQAMAVLVMISALGAINGLLFTGVRLYRTFGNDHRLFRFLGRENSRGVAINSLAAQTIFSLAIVALIETVAFWKPQLGQLLQSLGIDLGFEYSASKPGFDTLVIATAPVFWLFFTLTGIAYFVLRDSDAGRERPFKLTHPWYPLLPLAFLGSSLFMLQRSLDYALMQKPAEAIVVGFVLMLGIPLYFISGRPDTTHAQEVSMTDQVGG